MKTSCRTGGRLLIEAIWCFDVVSLYLCVWIMVTGDKVIFNKISFYLLRTVTMINSYIVYCYQKFKCLTFRYVFKDIICDFSSTMFSHFQAGNRNSFFSNFDHLDKPDFSLLKIYCTQLTGFIYLQITIVLYDLNTLENITL